MPRQPLFGGPFAQPQSGVTRAAVNAGEPLQRAAASLFQVSQLAFAIDKKKKVKAAELQAADQVGKANRELPGGQDFPALLLRGGASAEDTAFDNSARRIFRQRSEVAARAFVNEAARRHAGNPEALQAEIDAFGRGAMAEMDPIERGYFESALSTLATPLVKAEATRLFNARTDNIKGTIAALTDSRKRDAQTHGRLLAEGTLAGPDAHTAVVGTMIQTNKEILELVDGITFTEGEALAAIDGFNSDFVSRVTMGMFDGAANKSSLLTNFLRGDLKMDLPILNAQGEFEVTAVEVNSLLNADDQDKVRLYMTNRHSALEAERTRLRVESERMDDVALANSKKALALGGGVAAYEALVTNPRATDQDITEGRAWLQNGITDPQYFRAMSDQILLGYVTDPLQLDPRQLAFDDRVKLNDMINDQQNANHWSKSVNYTGAEDDVKKIVTQQVNDLIVGNLGPATAGQQSALRQQGAAALTIALRRVTQHHATVVDEEGRHKSVLGVNPTGKPEEIIKIKGPDGSPIEVIRFDPRAWVKQQTDRVGELMGRSKERVEAIRQEVRRLKIEWSNETEDDAKAKQLFDQMQAARRDLKAAKKEANALFVETIIEEFE